MLIKPIQAFDKTLLDVFNKGMRNPLLDIFFPLITKLGEVVVIFPVFLLLFLFGKKNGKRTSTLMVLAYLLSRLLTLCLKYLTHRPRPFAVYPDLRILEPSPFSSFPSGHATLVTALAVVIGTKYEDWQWLMWVLVGVVAMSRMYMGLHYPTDVASGIILGLGIGFATNAIEKIYDRKKRRSK